MIVIRCAIYCRLSREDKQKDIESESIQNQKSLLISFALQKGWDIYKIYSDEDYSGTDSTRPEFNRMLADAEKGCFSIVLCKSQSRFARDIEAVEKYIHNRFIEWGIRFVTVSDNVDTEIKGTKKARQLNGLINEWYLEDLSESIKAVLDNKRKNGQHIGSFAASGYKKCDENRSRLVVDETAAAVVRQIFTLYLSGCGKQKIADILNAKGIANPTEYKRLCGASYKNGSRKSCLWNKTTVGRILKNEVYIGNMIQGKKKKLSYKSNKIVDTLPEEWFVCENTHSAIISKSEFELVQKMLKAHTRSSGKGERHFLCGSVYCLVCGRKMCKASNCYKNGQRYYLRCRHGENNGCTASIPLNMLQIIITEQIKQVVAKYFDYGCLTDIALSESNNSSTDISELESSLNARRQALKLLYINKAQNKINDEQFYMLSSELISEINLLQSQLSVAENEKKTSSSAKNQDDAIKGLLNFDTLPGELFSLLIDKIYVGAADKSGGRQQIIISWLI